MRDEVFQAIQDLVRIPSVVGNEGDAQEWMAKLYHSLGLSVERVIPKKEDLIDHPAYVEIGFPYDPSRPNIVGIHPGTGSGRSLILNGHIDVVSPEPVETWDGRVPGADGLKGTGFMDADQRT